MKPLIAGNWKMNGLRSDLQEIETIAAASGELSTAIGMVICPPDTLVHAAVEAAGSSALSIGGQNCHHAVSGANTGDVSAEMLSDVGAKYVIVGHSERRTDHGETDTDIASKAEATRRARLIPIICIGESADERNAGDTLTRLFSQMEGSIPESVRSDPFVLAYEPIWAIGSGTPATEEQIAEVHAALRQKLIELCGENGQSVPILYGGSLNPANAGGILSIPEVNGGLIGGASLKASSFLSICETAKSLA